MGAQLRIDLDNLAASDLSFGVSKSAPFIKKGPFEAGFSASVKGPPVKFSGGFGISFEAFGTASFNVGFPLFEMDKSGIELDFGLPDWKWGKD